ncbi:putative serine/threonine-protein kinase [Phytophthora citrophthora]|uniref:Serine/threonine-protein kinase n=1 Tax=Phytophthora citrophthora TaxID=4793 RepID=A0AAD9GJV6_9STRA|nr:putative serine/threonine-protein kinase [Phytophthora citrophthora]
MLRFLERIIVTVGLGLLFSRQHYFIIAHNATDFVREYYNIYQANQSEFNETEHSLRYEREQDIPDEVSEKLQGFNLTFRSLPSLLQRALIWDSGYALGDNKTLAKVYTRCDSNTSSGVVMGNIGLSTKEITSAGCEIETCLTGNNSGVSWSFSSGCGPSQLDDLVKCACTPVKGKANEMPLWVNGGTSSSPSKIAISKLAIQRHTWSDVVAGRSAMLFAIHSSGVQDMTDLCALEPSTSLTIPCIEYRSSDDRWCRPKSSPIISKWLEEYMEALEGSDSGSDNQIPTSDMNSSSQYSNNDSSMADTNSTIMQSDEIATGHWQSTLPVLLVGAAALIVTGVAVCIYLRRRSDQRKADLLNSGANQLSMSSTKTSSQDDNEDRKPHRNNPLIDREDVFGNPHTTHEFIEMLSSSPSAWESSPLSRSLALTAESMASGSPKPDTERDAPVLSALASDPRLKHVHIPFGLLQFHHLISRGTRTEVWLCVLRDRCVAVKRLPKEERQNVEEIRTFVKTIRLVAPLQHPSILTFIGVAWNSLQNLCLVTEYLELGDLQEYLHQSNPNREQVEAYEDFMSFSMSWKREKMQILLDITRGLAYLHQKRIIHGDLKAKNVLLSADLDAKLSGFGSVCQLNGNVLDNSQNTLRLNSPFWTAPEVLMGGSHSEEADIYSLGVVVMELDTHQSPYVNTMTARGKRMSPLQILQHIMSGHLKPTLSPNCPGEIKELAEWCLQRDPNLRPSPSEVVRAIRYIPGFNLDEFSL